MQEEKAQSMRGDAYSVECGKDHGCPKYFGTIMLMICLLLVYLGYSNYQISKRLQSIEKHNSELLKYVENTKKQIDNVYELGKSLSISAQQKMDKLLTKIYYDLSQSAKATIDLANSKILRNEQKAKEALEIGKKLIKSGDIERGRIYIINAINHDPSNITYIEELVNIFREHYKSDYDKVSEVKAIVELSLFQLDPKDIDQAIQYLSELDNVQENIANSESTTSAEGLDLYFEFDKIMNDDLNMISTNPKELDDRYRKLNTILVSMQNDEANHENLIQAVVEEMERTKNLYQLATVAEKVQNYINLLKLEKNYASQSASSRFLAASSSASLFWEYDLSNLPQKLNHLVQQDLPEELQNIEKRIKEAKSRPYFEEAIKVLNDALNIRMGIYQLKIERSQNAIEEAIDLMRKIQFEDHVSDIRQKINILNKNIIVYKRNQYIEYQKWASSVIANVFDDINAETVFDDEDATRIFNSSYLRNIDLGLCSPEVREAYTKVFQEIVGELPPDKAFRIYKAIMTSPKKMLEDF